MGSPKNPGRHWHTQFLSLTLSLSMQTCPTADAHNSVFTLIMSTSISHSSRMQTATPIVIGLPERGALHLHCQS